MLGNRETIRAGCTMTRVLFLNPAGPTLTKRVEIGRSGDQVHLSPDLWVSDRLVFQERDYVVALEAMLNILNPQWNDTLSYSHWSL